MAQYWQKHRGKKRKEKKPSAVMRSASNGAHRCSGNLQMSAGCKHNILPDNQRFVTALATSVVMAEMIEFVSALAVQGRAGGDCNMSGRDASLAQNPLILW